MSFPFRAAARSYAGAGADTPYQRARQEWDARMGAAVLSARAWRATAIASLALAALLGSGLALVALRTRDVVHVVEVSPQGQVMQVRAAGARWTPNEAQIAHFLGRFVRLVRALPTDPIVLRENWLEAYRFLTPPAAARLSEIARADDPFLHVGKVGRVIHIRSIIARSERSWEVSWIERATNSTGTEDGQAYIGLFTVDVRAPRNSDEIAANPLGLMIGDFSWSRER